MDVMNEGMKQCAGGAFLGARECAWVCEELQDAGDAATAKSAEIQKLSEAGGNDNQALRMEAKHWSSASSCIMQLRQTAV